jgi:glycosyltransferase involved in cell wall biosynthesis
VVVHWHFGRIPALAAQNRWEWKLLCNAISKSTRSIVIDNKSLVTLKSAGFSNVLYIPNPVGSDFEQKARELYESGTQKVPGRLIFVGQLIRRKGIYELVEACSRSASTKELILIGPYQKVTENELFEIAKRRNNGDWLNLTGSLSRNAVLEYMQSSPVLVLPSYTEGFPNVVVEAMSVGCAVIATDVGAIPDMLAVTTDSPCGICVPVHNSEELMKAILILIEDPGKTEILGKNGIKRILDNYTLSKIVQQYRSVWRESALEGSSFARR